MKARIAAAILVLSSVTWAQPVSSPAYEKAVRDVAATVKGWPAGAGAALRLRNTANNKSVTMIFATKHALLSGKETKEADVFLEARDGDATKAILSIHLAELKPGKYLGTDSGCVIGLGMGPVFRPKAPDQLFSNNGDGSCLVEVTPAALPGHFELHISAKLVSTDKQSTFVAEPAYAYLVR